MRRKKVTTARTVCITNSGWNRANYLDDLLVDTYVQPGDKVAMVITTSTPETDLEYRERLLKALEDKTTDTRLRLLEALYQLDYDHGNAS